ncbi:MAG: phosphatidylserine decarboxylase family protein [Cytophagales bacterium]|nr:phosphatidylserine decarboxylase family protein [Cytophagales bacterium]
MMIHKEGRVFLFILWLFTSIIYTISFMLIRNYAWVILLFGSSFFIFFLQFFRNPKIEVEVNDNHIIAPCDGKVVVIEKTEEKEYFHDQKIQISIFMSPFNVHVNRNPVSGTVAYFKYHPGKYLVAWHPKSSTENERTTYVIKTLHNVEILVRQIAGAVARRIVWYVKKDDTVQQGNEFGFIKFGSRVDVFLPLHANVKVTIGQKTKGGKTILATFA